MTVIICNVVDREIERKLKLRTTRYHSVHQSLITSFSESCKG